MSDYIGLYYPHIAFPSDAWVKLAAVYWDKLGRIVPADYRHQDSDIVQQLEGELGFVEDFVPSRGDTVLVGTLFDSMIMRYGKQLISRYSALSNDSDLAYVYSEAKIAYELTNTLLNAGLAVRRKRGLFDTAQVGMHPKLAFVYMEALAAKMALKRGLRPVTDNVRDHVAMGEYTLERLAQALLDTGDTDVSRTHFVGAAPTADEIERQMASIALQSVLPQNIASVPVEKIIRLRKQHRIELTAFQAHIHEFVAKLGTIQQIDDPRAIKAHLEVAYEKEIKPQLDDLKKCMKSLAIETVVGVFNVKAALPPLIASAKTSLHLLSSVPPEVAGTMAIAWSIFPVFQRKRTEIYEKVHSSPAAYLLYAQEGLTPTNVVSQVRQATRHMLLGV